MRATRPQQYSLVKFDFTNVPAKNRKRYPFQKDRTYVFFGELANMKGHCIVMDHKTGKMYSGYHTEHFRELSERET